MVALPNKTDNITTADRATRQQDVRVRHSDKLSSHDHDIVASEEAVAISYNGQSHAVMMLSPIDLEDFAIGFSLSERIVDDAGDIKNIEVRQAKQGFTLDIHIPQDYIERLNGKRRQIAGRSGCGVCGITELAEAIPKLDPLSPIAIPAHSVVSKAVEQFASQQELQQLSGGCHAAALCCAKSGEMKLIREDIGRHNALDKLIGALENESFATQDHFVLMSSRASHELVVKTAIAGIGNLVTISAATSMAIDLAAKLNINLIGFVRGKRQIVYHQA